MKRSTTKKMTTLALFVALAVVMTMLIRVPLVPAVSFLTYDPKDIVIGIGGFLFGPLSALIISALSSLIELLFRGGNLIDVIMNIISTCTFVCTASWIYKRRHTKQGALIGLLAGMAANVASMLLWNYVMDPIYFGMPREAVVSMLPAIGLFNVLKCGINSGILLLIYKPVVNALRHSGLVEASKDHVSGAKTMVFTGSFVLLTVVIVVLSLQNVI